MGKIFISIIIFICIMAFNTISYGNDDVKVVNYNGVIYYGTLKDKSEFEIKLFLEPYKGEESRRALKFWGYDKLKPTRVIKEFKVSYSGKTADIPEKAIKDLTDINLPRGFYLMQISNGVIVVVRGGDGISGYKAKLKFVNHKLISRAIEHINKEGNLDVEKTNY